MNGQNKSKIFYLSSGFSGKGFIKKKYLSTDTVTKGFWHKGNRKGLLGTD